VAPILLIFLKLIDHKWETIGLQTENRKWGVQCPSVPLTLTIGKNYPNPV